MRGSVVGYFGFVAKSRYLGLEEENNHLNESIQQLKERISELMSELEAVQQKLEKLKHENREMSEGFVIYRRENGELSTKNEQLLGEREVFQKTIQELTTRINRGKW